MSQSPPVITVIMASNRKAPRPYRLREPMWISLKQDSADHQNHAVDRKCAVCTWTAPSARARCSEARGINRSIPSGAVASRALHYGSRRWRRRRPLRALLAVHTDDTKVDLGVWSNFRPGCDVLAADLPAPVEYLMSTLPSGIVRTCVEDRIVGKGLDGILRGLKIFAG